MAMQPLEKASTTSRRARSLKSKQIVYVVSDEAGDFTIVQDISVFNGYTEENVRFGGSIPFLINMHEAFLMLQIYKTSRTIMYDMRISIFFIPIGDAFPLPLA
jgi:hypothetical protein